MSLYGETPKIREGEPWDAYVRRVREWQNAKQPDSALAGDWPATPPVVGAEQQGLGLEGSTTERYAAWRATEASRPVMRDLARIALRWRREQPHALIGGRALWEAMKRERGHSVDNRFQALACREVEDKVPELKGAFRHRDTGRKAS